MNSLQLKNSFETCLEFHKKTNSDVILTPDDLRVIQEFLKVCQNPITHVYTHPDDMVSETLGEGCYGPYWDVNGITNLMHNLFQKYPNICNIMCVIASFQKIIEEQQINGLISIIEQLPKDIFDNLTITRHTNNYCLLWFEDALFNYFEEHK